MSNVRPLIIVIFLFATSVVQSSSQISLTLDDVLVLAEKQSVEYQIERNAFLSDYWNYKMSKIKLLPKINLNATPIAINRSLTERYDFQTNIETFRESKTFSSNSGLSINQPIPITGGNISIGTNIHRISNFGITNFTSYSVTPLRVTYSQPLFSHNSYRWDKIVLPLKLIKAEQKLVESKQNIYLKVILLYFNLLRSTQLHEVAEQDVINSDLLYNSGKKLLELKTITQYDLVELELKKTDAEILFAQKEKELKKARYELNKLLRLDVETIIKPDISKGLPDISISADEAIVLAQKSNPIYTEIEQQTINLQSSLDQTKKKNRFKANLNLSYGLSQSGNSISEALQRPRNQQTGSFSFSIPILNWGVSKGDLMLAKKNLETTELMNQKRVADFEDGLIMKVIDFNLQAKVIKSSLTAEKLATKLYKLKMQQFTLGKVNLMELNNSQLHMLKATENYIGSIFKYWTYYYELQKLMLHDMTTKQELTEDFEALMSLFD